MQVGEQHLARAQHLDLGRLRLLDLQDQVGLGEHRLRVGHDARALGLVVGVGDRAALAGARLDQDLVAALDQLARARGRQRDAVLVGLDLGRDADLHAPTSSVALDVEGAAACLQLGEQVVGVDAALGREARRARRSGRAPAAAAAAAAGAAVETMPPPSPQRSTGRVTARTRTARPRRAPRSRGRTRCLAEAGAARRPLLDPFRLGGAGELAQAFEQRGGQREPEARLARSRSSRGTCAAPSAA